jgi:uncharacterized protein YeaO (DUF488 family)
MAATQKNKCSTSQPGANNFKASWRHRMIPAAELEKRMHHMEVLYNAFETVVVEMAPILYL